MTTARRNWVHRCPGAKAFRAVATAISLLLCSNVLADTYLEESFNYPAGQLGMNTPWNNPSALITVAATNLTYAAGGLADLAPSGNAACVSQGSPTTVNLRSLSTVPSNGIVYCSFVMQYTNVYNNNSANYLLGLLPPTVGNPNGNASDPCDLYIRTTNTNPGFYFLGIRAKGSSSISYLPRMLALNEIVFIVMKYDFASGNTSLYLDPIPDAEEPAAADAVNLTASGAVSSLDRFYLRVGAPIAGVFFIDNVRVASTWAETTPSASPTPAARLVFTKPPAPGVAGGVLSNIVVQIQNSDGIYVASNNVPITMSFSDDGAFSNGTTTVLTDVYGRATFNDLVVATPGHFILNAAASGIGTGLAPAASDTFPVGLAGGFDARGAALGAFLDSLQVERYWAGGVSVNWLTGASGGSGPQMTQGSATHCSAFAGAVTKLLGVYLLRQPDASDLGLANVQADWFSTNTFGWFPIPAPEIAQYLANIGDLVVASYKNPDPNQSGHIAIMRPSTRSTGDLVTFGPQECQSGTFNYNDTNVFTGFGLNYPGNVRFYGHLLTNAAVPANPSLSPGSLKPGGFSLDATSVVGRKYKLQRSDDLASWVDVTTFTNSNADTNFWHTTTLNDAAAAGVPRRFYRLLAQ